VFGYSDSDWCGDKDVIGKALLGMSSNLEKHQSLGAQRIRV